MEPVKAVSLTADLPAASPEELFTELVAASGVRIERIVSWGNVTPAGEWYDQDWNEWVLLLAGAARLRFEGQKEISLQPGQCVDIPAHRRHRVEWTDPDRPTVWVAVHYP